MKTTKLFLAYLVFMAVQFANAQVKVAHVDTQDIMQNYPAMKSANKELEQISKTYEGEMKTMVETFQTKLKKYQEEFETTDAKTKEERAKEMEDMEKRIGDYRTTAQKDIQEKEKGLMQPLYDKVKASIEKVGRALGYQYVFDASSALLSDGPNITSEVKKDLGF